MIGRFADWSTAVVRSMMVDCLMTVDQSGILVGLASITVVCDMEMMVEWLLCSCLAITWFIAFNENQHCCKVGERQPSTTTSSSFRFSSSALHFGASFPYPTPLSSNRQFFRFSLLLFLHIFNF